MNLHIVPATMYSIDLLKFPFQKEYPSGWEGLPVTITQNGLGITIAGPGNKVVGRVSSSDYVVQGGILHIIDLALVPSLEVMREEATFLRTINPIFEA
jgi:hypothetical protein